MAQPIDVIMGYGESLLDGNLAELAARYSMPCVVSMRREQHIIDDRAALEHALSVLRDHLRAQGVEQIKSQVQSQVRMMDDMIVASVDTRYLDAAGDVIDCMRTSYMMRTVGDSWKIVTLTVDEPISGVDRLCIPQDIAA